MFFFSPNPTQIVDFCENTIKPRQTKYGFNNIQSIPHVSLWKSNPNLTIHVDGPLPATWTLDERAGCHILSLRPLTKLPD